MCFLMGYGARTCCATLITPTDCPPCRGCKPNLIRSLKSKPRICLRHKYKNTLLFYFTKTELTRAQKTDNQMWPCSLLSSPFTVGETCCTHSTSRSRSSQTAPRTSWRWPLLLEHSSRVRKSGCATRLCFLSVMVQWLLAVADKNIPVCCWECSEFPMRVCYMMRAGRIIHRRCT